MKKRLLSIASLLLCISLLLAGCGRKWDVSDAEAYVKSSLDANYKEDFDEFITLTDSTLEEAQQMYDENMENVIASMVTSSSSNLSDELKEQYRQLFSDLFKLTKYTIRGGAKKGEGFTVDVSIEPLTVLETLQDDLTTEIENSADELTELENEDAITQWAFQKTYDLISRKMANPVYGEETVLTVNVVLKDDLYTINEDDLLLIDSTLIPVQQ